MTAVSASSLAELTGPGFLRPLLGPIESLDRRPLGALGYSGSTHERLEVRLGSGERSNLVFKHVRLAQDWTAYRTGDTLGREAALLTEPALDRVWDVFACPYLAHAVEEGEIGLLMQDVSEHLFPDVDDPLTEAQEDALLAALATLHAQYWNADILRIPWLATPAHLFAVLGPSAGEEESRRPAPHPLFDMVRQGWTAARARLPEAAIGRLTQPAGDFARECSALPRTLLHGDAKVANFALLAGGRVAAFDWAWIGAGPCTLDLGWYLAVNAGRLARTREGVIARYRGLLEAGLGRSIPTDLWERLLSTGLLCGAAMLLWEKALALESGTRRASDEWDWWVRQLVSRANRLPATSDWDNWPKAR
jgi:hypothetical protein